MAANTREVKTRLRGVRKTQQITRAMKMVATVRLRHAQVALANSRPYAEKMIALASDLLGRIDRSLSDSPFFARRPVAQASTGALRPSELSKRENILFIITSSDRGLCGSMNANVFRHVLRTIDELSLSALKLTAPNIRLLLIGRKAKDFFSSWQSGGPDNLPYSIVETLPFGGLDAVGLGARCCEFYRKGEFDRIDLFYNESISTLQHHSACATIFPINFAGMRKQADRLPGNVIFEPDCDAMLDAVIHAYISARFRKIMLEAEVAEHAARMMMMDLATKNADELITGMQLTMNKLRQLAITNELADITTGAEAIA